MTVSTTATRVQYDGNGSTTAFAVPFKFLADTDLVVIVRVTATLDDTTKTLTTHYAVSGAGASSGGTVTLHTPPESTETVLIYNNTPLTQSVDYVSGDAFPAETHEQALDKLTLQQQRTRDLVSRAVTMDDGDPAATGPYNAQGLRMGNLGTPTASLDAATKGYVDVEVVNAGLVIPSGVTANNSTEERSLGERWSERRSPLDFGAVGDGVADDSAAIQACFDAVRDYGGIVSFPLTKTFACKEINLDFNPAIDQTSPLIIEGNGCTLKVHSSMAVGERVMEIAGGNTDKRLVMRDLTFEGTGVDGFEQALLRVSCDGAYLENCRFTNHKQSGLDFACLMGTVLNCEFDDLGDVTSDDEALECSYAGVEHPLRPRGIRIIGCYFHDCRYVGINLQARRAIVEGCVFEDMVDAAVRIVYKTTAPAYDVQIINNIVRGITAHATATDTGGVGFWIYAVDGVRISGNQIRECDKQGIRLIDCAYADVSNNVIGNIGRSDNDDSCNIDGDTTFTMDDADDIGGTALDVAPGQKVVHAAFPTDTFVDSVAVNTITTDVAAITSPGAGQEVTFITGGYCIALESSRSGSGTGSYATDRRLRNISITDNVFYDDNSLFTENDPEAARAYRVSITRGGITMIGEGEPVENIVVRGNIFAPELFNNKNADYDVFEHNANVGRMWKPGNGNVIEDNAGLTNAITRASAVYFALDDLNIGNEPTFVVTGSINLNRCQSGRGGMRMTLIWDTGATFSIANLYPSGYSDLFSLRDNNNAVCLHAGSSITFECVETDLLGVSVGTTASTNIMTVADSSDYLLGMSVRGAGIPHETQVGFINNVVAGGGRAGTDGTTVTLDATFTSEAANFTADDVGRTITIDDAFVDLESLAVIDLVCTIASINAENSVELSIAPAAAFSGDAVWSIAAGVDTLELYAGPARSYPVRYSLATDANARVTFTSRTWHEVSRGTKIDARGVSPLDDSGTPTVLGGTVFLTTGGTAITGFDDGCVGQTIMIKAEHTVTITDGTNLELAGDFAMADGDSITLTMFEDGKWTEISRSDTT